MNKKIFNICLLLIFFGNGTTAMLEAVPDEVLKEHMLPCLSYQDLIQLRAVNKRFHELANGEISDRKLIRFHLNKKKITHKFNAFKKMLKKHKKIVPENTIIIETKNMQKHGFEEEPFIADTPDDIKKIIKKIKYLKYKHRLLTNKERDIKQRRQNCGDCLLTCPLFCIISPILIPICAFYLCCCCPCCK